MNNKTPSRVHPYGMASEFLFREKELSFQMLVDLKY